MSSKSSQARVFYPLLKSCGHGCDVIFAIRLKMKKEEREEELSVRLGKKSTEGRFFGIKSTF